MALIPKDNPVGVDKPIDTIQNALYDALVTNGEWTNYESYPRAHKNETENGIKPELFTGNGSDYVDAYMDDKFAVTSFFLVPDNIPSEDDMRTATISIIFQINLDKIYTTAPHRFDAEMHNQIETILSGLDGRFTFIDTITSIDDVYAGLDTERVQLNNTHPCHVVRFEIEANYIPECNPAFATTACTVGVTVEATAETSLGADDGQAKAIVTGAQGNITYLWNDPLAQTTETATNLAAGTYIVVVSDDNEIGCTATASGTVEAGTPIPVCDIEIDSFTIEGANETVDSGSATVVISGNVGSPVIVWSDGQTTNPATNLPVGPIGVAVSDSGVGATCLVSGVADIFNRNLNSWFLDGVNDNATLGTNVQETNSYTFQCEFNSLDFSTRQGVSSNGNTEIIVIEDDSNINIFLGTSKIFAVPTMSTDTWYHMLVVCDDIDIKLYLNGVESTTGSIICQTFRIAKIGEFLSGAFPFIGSIDNFGLTDLEATPAQIATLYNDPSSFETVFGANTTIFYKCDGVDTDTTLTDSSANNNDATLNGYILGSKKFLAR